MKITWKAALAGSTIAGVGLGGFAAVAPTAAQSPERADAGIVQLTSVSSPLGAVVRMKVKGDSWHSLNDVDSVSVASPFSDGSSSMDSPSSPDSPNSPDSPDSPSSPNSPASPDSPDSPASPASPRSWSSASSGS